MSVFSSAVLLTSVPGKGLCMLRPFERSLWMVLLRYSLGRTLCCYGRSATMDGAESTTDVVVLF